MVHNYWNWYNGKIEAQAVCYVKNRTHMVFQIILLLKRTWFENKILWMHSEEQCPLNMKISMQSTCLTRFIFLKNWHKSDLQYSYVLYNYFDISLTTSG